ncbi:DUF2199 domain-containing protein [Kitasatospora purpeofusca]|uniref:DUF2199 domain-containing protein n=1 Tax=Kitasatospora purpeofusca TaxID=67352 RepID=UPI00225689F3|nr:DUF2199 domain-containing protein [Kitasatospora purpeofusca]MCX4759201.1 DUF2199 domain-containing protein [Kitasatospora purpeofusca]WSR30398.1 DUF2199 domain-containing protein [Kitasatospora purpeofusca]WSR38638.1 DUF2199 domain-containing protein [Kitasatospora purpeofusca]
MSPAHTPARHGPASEGHTCACCWEDPAREQEPPYFGRPATGLPVCRESTLLLKTRVRTRAVGVRPLIELEPTGHSLAVEQREGITVERVRAFADQLLGG